jgi:Tol biopolymer transport system component
VRRLLVAAALAALVVAGCGSSTPKGPPALVFVSVKDGDYALFGMGTGGKHVHRLTKDKGDPSTPAGLFWQTEPTWSPDGQHIAFTSKRDGAAHVFSMRYDGTDTRRLTDSSQEDSHPSWSPDGKWIVFAREGAIFRIPAAGGAATRVGKGFGNAENPEYSPDGKLIAYDYRQPGYSIREVYVMNADGSHAHPITNLRAVSGFPTWSPDAKQIAFASDAGSGYDEIYTVPAGGGQVKRIIRGPTALIQPAWSPDGKKIAYSLDGAIWTAGGGQVKQLTSGADNDSDPAWRPRTAQ